MMNCRSCGASVAADDQFCGECGTPLGAGDSSASSVEPAGASPLPSLSPPLPADGRSRAAFDSGSGVPTLPLPGSPSDSPVLGESIPNAHYTGLRLVYADGQAESLDPLNGRFMKALIFHWSVFWGFSVIALLVLFVLGMRSLGVLWLLALVGFSFVPVLASISEWKFMVDGKGSVAPDTFAHIVWVMRQRETPVDKLDVRRVRLGHRASRDYLYAQLTPFRAYVSCFPFGHDLYIGWTFWWRLSTVRWWMLIFRRMFQALTLRGAEVHNVHRYDNAKALREAIHSATREGVDAASGTIGFKGGGTIGSDIPVETVDIPDDPIREGFPGG
jgi:hypothetical protein